MRSPFLWCRVFLVLTLAIAAWMTNCDAPLSIQRIAKSQVASALRGASRAQLPLLLAGSKEVLTSFKLTKEDCVEVEYSNTRDFVFIGSYLICYLALARLLWERVTDVYRKLAIGIALLVVALAAFDVMEDLTARQLMDTLYRSAFPTGSVSTDGVDAATISALRRWSLVKWAANFTLNGMLALGFLSRRWNWSTIAGIALLGSGTVGLLATGVESISANSGWTLGMIEMGFVLGLLGGAIVTVLFVAKKNDAELRPDSTVSSEARENGPVSNEDPHH